MDQFEKQCKVTKTVPILPTVNHFLQQKYEAFEYEPTNFVSFGGVTKDLKYAWIVNGPKFQVIEVQSGSRVASWLFGGIYRDKRTRITCVAELSNNIGTAPLFVIGLDCETTGGIICIFNIMGSKIMRTIQLDDRVCNLHIVDSGDNVPGILKNLDGIIAVGTCGGDTYLIDLCRHMWINENIFDEMNYNKLFKRLCSQINLGILESYRAHAVQNNEHLALQLNVSTNSLFLLSTPQGTNALQLPRDKVRISSFLYVPKLISLLVGYNFGAWQIYNLLTLELEYTSPVYDEIVPVSHFAYQEPSDDPRAFCYVWAVYSNDIESKHASVPLAAMYALAYESKDNIEYYGTLYQNFMSCSLRFQMDLLPITDARCNVKAGHCISLQTCMVNSSNNTDSTSDHNLTLCMIVWSVWSEYDNEPNIIMALIDLDQWYKEQMPATLRDRGNECYISKFDLSRILNIGDNLSIFNVNIDPTSISPFTTVQRLEEHYYPSALTFDFIVMQKTEFTFIKNNGLQRTLLLTLEKNGVNSFLNAQSLARQCSEAGLNSICSSDIISPKLKSQHMSSPQTHLLSLALEFNLIGLLTTCAEEWATGAYASAGCTLGMFVEWATQRSEILQQKANELCVSLFDYSDINLDCNSRKILDQCAIQMHHLSSVFKLIKKNCTEYLNMNAKIEINEQLRAIQMFSDRLEVLQWLLNVGLLPEAPIKSYNKSIDLNERMRAPYPVEELYKIYNERRSKLNEGTNSLISKNKSCELLFIDNFIEYECGGERLRNEWRCDTNINGLYPPPSIQALLRTYLIDHVDLKFKHTILVYVFLDLAVTLDQTKYESIITHLIKFPAVFRLSPCHIKMTQAFWQLDHGDFTIGMEQLLDPLIGGGTAQDEFKPWQHRTVLRSLLANKQYKYAALYIQIRQPALTDMDEIVNAMNLLLANNMLHAAFEFQRRHQTVHNKSLLLEKFFEGCLEENLITSALKLSLSQDEEDYLIKVLQSYNKEDINLQLIYYLQRSRGFDVLRVGDKYYRDHQRGGQMGLIGQNSLQLPQILLNTYANVIPNITKKIYNDFRAEFIEKKQAKVVSKVQIPTPMSVKIKESKNTIKYKSNTIINSINKIRETWTSAKENTQSNDLDTTPFLCIPKQKLLEHQSVTPVTYPKITYQNHERNIKKRMTEDNFDDDLTFNEQNPSKRFKYDSNQELDVRLLTPSSNVFGIQKQNHTAPEKLLLTPIVKRKYSESPKSVNSVSSNLPSILKIRLNDSQKKNTRGRSITPNLEDCTDSSEESTMKSSSHTLENNSPNEQQLLEREESLDAVDKVCTRSKLGATPRKNLIRTLRPVVHFEEVASSENTMQTSETNINDSYLNKTENKVSEKNNSSIDTSSIHYASEECKLREEEVKSVARKLGRKSSPSPYKSIKPRKSLQRTVLESSLVKNITPVLKRSKRIASRQASSNTCGDGTESSETDNESFNKHITMCSSPTSIQSESPSPRKSSRKQLNNENFVEIMEEKYSHTTTSIFSSDNNSSNKNSITNKSLIENEDSNVTESFINRMNKECFEDSSSFENYSYECPKRIATRIGDIIVESKHDVKMDELPISFSTSDERITTKTNLIETTDDSIVTESFIKRMEAKCHEFNPNDTNILKDSITNKSLIENDNSSNFENYSYECPKRIVTRIGDIIPESKHDVKMDKIPVDTTNFLVSNLEIAKITKTQNENCVTSNLKQQEDHSFDTLDPHKEQPVSCVASNSKIIIAEDNKSKPIEINKPKVESPPEDSIVTQSFIERMEKEYDCKDNSSIIDDSSFKCPKRIQTRLGDMIVETIDPIQVDVKFNEISSFEIPTSSEIQSNSFDQDDSLVTESFIQKMENKYKYELSTSVTDSTSIYNSVDTNKKSDDMSSKETSSVYCSVEEIDENSKKPVEDPLTSEDDYSFQLEGDEDDDDDNESEDDDEEHDNNSTLSKESSKHDVDEESDDDDSEEKMSEDTSDSEKQVQHDPNEIVEISSDEEDNSYDSSSSSSLSDDNQKNETIENDKIQFNECIVFEEHSSDNELNKSNIVNENMEEIIEISEVTEAVEESCDIYQDLEVVVAMPEDNQINENDDNQVDKVIEVVEISEIPQKKLFEEIIEIPEAVENENQSQDANKVIETTEIQYNIKCLEQSETHIEALETNKNQQQIELNKNTLLFNTMSNISDDQNLNCKLEFTEVKNITNLENQEKDIEIEHQSDMVELQETIPTRKTCTLEPQPSNEKVLTSSASNNESNKNKTLEKIVDEIQLEKENIKELNIVKPRRRTRQNSVDSCKSETPIPVVTKPTLRSRRATSIDISSPNVSISTANIPTPQKRITRSSSDMNVSQNQLKVTPNPKTISTRRRSLRSTNSKESDVDTSILEEYSTSRRLTRKQKSMLEKIELPKILPKNLENNDFGEDSDDETHELIDPIKLLDKKSFEGSPDPDEQKLLLQRSPASSIKTTSSFQSVDNTESRTKLRNLRSRSIDLDTTLTTNKLKLKSSSSSDIVISTTPKRRITRRLSQLSINQTPEKDEGSSESGSQVSTRSRSSVAKRLKDLSPEVGRSPRRSSRLNSPQLASLDEHKGPSSSTKTVRRSILSSDLPIISEETVEQGSVKKRKDTEEHTNSPAKRNRSKLDIVKQSSKKK